jgi:hypothetical protein
MSVEDVRGSLLRKMFIADFVKMGYKVNYLMGPNENKETFLEDIKVLLGNEENINIVTFNPKDFGYKADRISFPKSVETKNAVNFINLLAEEDFAVKDPVEYEIFVMDQVKKDIELNRITYIIGYSNQEAIKVQLKYANVVRKMTVSDGFTFWRSIRPLGPLYIVDINTEKGAVDFIEVV